MIDLHYWILFGIAIFDLAVMAVVMVALVLGEDAWRAWPVRACVFIVSCGLGAEAAYTFQVIANDAVPLIFPSWVLKDVGIGLLLLMDVFIPNIYWTGEKNVGKT